jgi:hypothetical protein
MAVPQRVVEQAIGNKLDDRRSIIPTKERIRTL